MLAAPLLRVFVRLLWAWWSARWYCDGSGARRMRCIARWSAQLLRIFRIRLQVAAGNRAAAHGLGVANHVSRIDAFIINA